MIKLTKRLQTVAEIVSPTAYLADVGCDHGYLSIYLYESGKAKNVYALDINEGPLSKAKENIKRAGYENEIKTILGNGLMPLENEMPLNTAVICGMGGPLGLNILYNRKDFVSKLDQVVLQLQSDLPMVRYMLKKWDFLIENETMCFEDGKFYFIIKAKPSKTFADAVFGVFSLPVGLEDWTEYWNIEKNKLFNKDFLDIEECMLPDILKKNAPKDYEMFVNNELRRMYEVRKSLLENDGEKARDRLEVLDRDIKIYESKR